MDHLLGGIHQFHTQVVQREREFFQQLAAGQSPSALFISCSDSRVDPSLITQSNLGELFVLRNAGNMVPPFGASNGGESAAVEYAVSVLGVRDIVVCGHSQCGAMKALLDPESMAKLPVVRAWMSHAAATRQLIEENYPNQQGEKLLEITVQEHALMQIENLQTHPSVAAKLQRQELTLHAWVYHLETGEILAFSSEQEEFVPLAAAVARAGIAVPETRKLRGGPG
jgi:carbonic anhydrase